MSLLDKFQTLISIWFPNKTQDQTNFNTWTNELLSYTNGALLINSTVWQPLLNGETGANYKYSYSESNGEGVGKGFVLKGGFPNTDEWTLSFDFKHDNIKYTGICFLCNVETYTIPDSDQTTNVLKTWEGSWSGGSSYSNSSGGSVGYFDVKVTKVDSTHVRLQSTSLNRDTTVEVSWLPSAKYLSCGAIHNGSSNSYGPCRIKNVRAEVTL